MKAFPHQAVQSARIANYIMDMGGGGGKTLNTIYLT